MEGLSSSRAIRVAPAAWRFLGAPTLASADLQVQCIAVDPRDDQTLYAGTLGGLYVTRDAGGSWKQPVQGEVIAVALDPRDADRVYAIVDSQELWRSIDRGQSFSLVKRFDDLLYSLRFSLYQPGTLYVGFGGYKDPNPSGTFKTADDGVTWIRQPFGVTGALIPWSVAEDPADGTLYSGTEIADHPQPYHPQLFRSMDFGQTWTDATGIITWHVVRLGVDRSSHAVYALTEGPGLYRSLDHGQTWSQVATNVGLSLAVDPIQSSRLFTGTLVAGVVNGGVFASLEGGVDSVPYGLSGRQVGDLALNGLSTKLYAACFGSGIYVTDLPGQ